MSASLNWPAWYWDKYRCVLVWFGGWLWSSALTHGLSKVFYQGHVTSESCGDGVHWLTAFDSQSATANAPPEILQWNMLASGIRAVWARVCRGVSGLGQRLTSPCEDIYQGLRKWHLNGTRDEERRQLLNEIGNQMAAACQASRLTVFKHPSISLQSESFYWCEKLMHKDSAASLTFALENVYLVIYMFLLYKIKYIL